jgi:selenide,water dikinase
VHSCTDVTGFALLGHSYEMAQGSGCTLHIEMAKVPYHPEAYEMAEMGFIPAGAYRNREYAEGGVKIVNAAVSRAMQDICYDPQTSGGLLIALPEQAAAECIARLQAVLPQAAQIGYVTEALDAAIYLE